MDSTWFVYRTCRAISWKSFKSFILVVFSPVSPKLSKLVIFKSWGPRIGWTPKNQRRKMRLQWPSEGTQSRTLGEQIYHWVLPYFCGIVRYLTTQGDSSIFQLTALALVLSMILIQYECLWMSPFWWSADAFTLFIQNLKKKIHKTICKTNRWTQKMLALFYHKKRCIQNMTFKQIAMAQQQNNNSNKKKKKKKKKKRRSEPGSVWCWPQGVLRMEPHDFTTLKLHFRRAEHQAALPEGFSRQVTTIFSIKGRSFRS